MILAVALGLVPDHAAAQIRHFGQVCHGAADGGGQLWYFFNPNNAQSNATYYRSGDILCEDGGEDVIELARPTRHWTCATTHHTQCTRDESWDGTVSGAQGTIHPSWLRDGREASVHSYAWAVGDYAPWTIYISQ